MTAKKIILIITAIAIVSILSIGTIRAVYADNTASSSTSKFRIDNKVLTVYVGNDTLVTIPNDVMVIGERAFEDNTDVTVVEFPEYLTGINYKAFYGCTGLTDITIKDTVTKVGPGAFMGCENIEYFQIGKSVKSWGSGVFNNCNKLSELILHTDNTYLTYWDGALYNGDMSFLYQVLPGREGENYVVPSETQLIDTYSLYNLQNVENIRFAGEVQALQDYAMKNLGSVKNVILPEGMTSIGKKAFADNENLLQVYIPESVEVISKDAFSGTENVSILTTKNSYADKFGKEHEIPVIYEKILPTDFADSNPSGEEKPDLRKKIVISTDVEPLTDEIEKEETKKETDNEEQKNEIPAPITYEQTVTESTNVIGKTTVVNGKAILLMNNHTLKVLGEPADTTLQDIDKAKDITQVNAKVTTENTSVDYNLTSILQRKYYGDKTLKNFDIDSDIQNIGRLAFARSSVKSVTIPDSVVSIEYGAFYNCEALDDITIGNGISNISTKVFAGTPWLENWQNGLWGEDDFLIIGDGILIGYRGESDVVVIPDGVKQIGPEAFIGNTTITNVLVPSSVNKICTDAFKNCSNLEKVAGCSGLKTIIHGSFNGTIYESNF